MQTMWESLFSFYLPSQTCTDSLERSLMNVNSVGKPSLLLIFRYTKELILERSLTNVNSMAVSTLVLLNFKCMNELILKKNALNANND